MEPHLLEQISCILGLYICFLIRCTYSEGVQISEEKLTEIDGTLKDLLKCGDGKSIQGLSSSIVYKGEVVFARGYGVTDMSHPQTVTENTLFGIGPLTKTFTSTLLIKQLHDHPRFSLDTPLSKMLPGKFRFHDTLRTALANSKDLLDNKMGLVPHRYMVFQQGLTRKRLAFKMRHMRRAGKFRASNINSDIMYSLAAFVSETLSQSSWEKLMSREIFLPLKMTQTTFFNQLKPGAKNLASVYLRHKGLLKNLPTDYFSEASKLGGAQSMVSNAVDMAKWMSFILSNGRTKEGRKLLHQEIIRESYSSPNETKDPTDSSVFKSPDFPHTWYDYGPHKAWREGMYRGKRVLSSIKSGRSLVVGYQSHISLILSDDIGIFTTSTGNGLKSLALTAVHAHIADVLLGMEMWLNNSTLCAFPAPWISPPSRLKKIRAPADQQLQAVDYQLFVGVYYNSIYGRIIVFKNTGIGRLQLQYGAIRANLHPLKTRGKFRAKGLHEFWLFRITCIFKTKPDKSTSLSIPDFVPNYPTNPMLFKYTDAEVPEEYKNLSKITLTLSQEVSSVPATHGDEVSTASSSINITASISTSFEHKTLPNLNSTFAMSTISPGIVSKSGAGNQSRSRLQTTDPLPSSTSFETASSTLDESPIGKPSMTFTKAPTIDSTEFNDSASSKLYPSTHTSQTPHTIPSTTQGDTPDTPVSPQFQTSQVASTMFENRDLSTAKDIITTAPLRVMENSRMTKESPYTNKAFKEVSLDTEVTSETSNASFQTSQITSTMVEEKGSAMPEESTYAYKTFKVVPEGESESMATNSNFKLTTVTSQRVNSPKLSEDVTETAQRVINYTLTKISHEDVTEAEQRVYNYTLTNLSRKPTSSNPLDANDEGVLTIANTTIPHSKVNSATKTSRDYVHKQILRTSARKTTMGISTTAISTMKDMEKGVLNSDSPNIGTSNYSKKNQTDLCYITSIVILLWFTFVIPND